MTAVEIRGDDERERIAARVLDRARLDPQLLASKGSLPSVEDLIFKDTDRRLLTPPANVLDERPKLIGVHRREDVRESMRLERTLRTDDQLVVGARLARDLLELGEGGRAHAAPASRRSAC